MARRILHEIKLDKIAAVDSPCQEPARVVIMKRATPEEIAAAAALAKGDSRQHQQGDTDMLKDIAKALGLPETATEADVTAALAKNATATADLQASVATITKVAALTDAQKAHYADLEKADKAKASAFLDMKAEDKDAEVKKASAGDESVVIEGRTISKRAVGDDMFAILKAQAERITKSEADIKKANEATANAVFTKRAETEFAHVAGTVEERVAVLKALDSADPAAKAAGEAVLKAAESVAKLAFEKLGHSNDGDGATSIKKATDAFEGKVSEIMKRDSTNRHDAMSKAAVEFPDELAAFQEASSQAA